MADRKWNNQGGSNRDGFNFKRIKPRETGNIPPFEDLKESQITSFRLFKPRRPKPNYGEFGDAIWVYDFYDDDLTIKEPEIDIPEIREPSTDIRDTYISDYDPENASIDIFPYAIEDEYELVVKYKIGTGTLKIYISSGQAFAARNDINDRIFDLSLVVESSQPISLDNRQPALINTITLLNSAQNPIYSMYEWLLGKLSIVTDYSAENPDPIISNLRLNGDFIRLPPTEFTFNSIVHNLFYGNGKEPEQICLFAINKVLKYDRSRDPEEGNWSVTYAANELPLCLDLNPDNPDLPIVLIQFTLGSLEEIKSTKSNSVAEFATIRVVLLEPIATPLEVFVRISGTADPVFIAIDEVDVGTVSAVNASTLKFIIPANTSFVEAEIKADMDPDQIGSKTVITSLLPDPNYQIDAGNDLITTTIILPQPIVSIVFNSGSPTRLKAGNGAFFAYVSRDYIRNSVGLDVDLAFTGDAAFDEYQVDNFAFSNQYQVNIPSGQSGVVVKIEPNTTRAYQTDRSIIATVIPYQADTSLYAIDQTKKSVTATIAFAVKILVIKSKPNYSNPDADNDSGYGYISPRKYSSFIGRLRASNTAFLSNTDSISINSTTIDSDPTFSSIVNGSVSPYRSKYLTQERVAQFSSASPVNYTLQGASYTGNYNNALLANRSNQSVLIWRQIDLDLVTEICNLASKRYYILLVENWFLDVFAFNNFNDSPYGTISASIGDIIPDTDISNTEDPTFNRGLFRRFVHNPSELTTDHPINSIEATRKKINWQWVDKYQGINGSDFAYLMAYSIQIDSQTQEFKFLDVFSTQSYYYTSRMRLIQHRSPVVT